MIDLRPGRLTYDGSLLNAIVRWVGVNPESSILNPGSSALAQCARERKQVFDGNEGGAGLGRAPIVEHGDLLHAGNGAMRRAGFLGMVLVGKVLGRVFLQGDGRKAALLRAIMHQAVFANVEVAAAGAASPVVRDALRNVFLKLMEARVRALAHLHDLREEFLLTLAQGLK